MEYFSLNAAIAKADELSQKTNKQYIVYSNNMVKYIVKENDGNEYTHLKYTTK